jgi:hypothetical protein
VGIWFMTMMISNGGRCYKEDTTKRKFTSMQQVRW